MYIDIERSIRIERKFWCPNGEMQQKQKRNDSETGPNRKKYKLASTTELPAYLLYELHVMATHEDTEKHKTWHWKDVAEDDLYKAGFITDFNKHRLNKRFKRNGGIGEFGLDGLALDVSSGTYHGIQAKNYHMQNKLTADKLGTFQSVVFNRLRVKDAQSKGYLYYSGSLQTDLREDLQNGDAIVPIYLAPLVHKPSRVPDEIHANLYPPQEEALRGLLREDWRHGFISLPCGVGKTLVLGNYVRATHYSRIILVSPLRILAKQLLERIQYFLPRYSSLLADVDGDLDVENLKMRLLSTHSIVSTTIKSYATLFPELLSGMNLDATLVVFDEGHHLRSTTIADSQQAMIYSTFSRLNKVLLLTGTPTADVARSFQEIFHYKLCDAIRDGYICDYDVYLPEACARETQLPIELRNMDVDATLMAQALFLINGMLLRGGRRCIAYMGSIEECGRFMRALQLVCAEYHVGVTLWAEEITANTARTRRTQLLNEFEHDMTNDLHVLSSVHIMDEGVNVVKCDAVFLHNTPNDIAFVQRLCRANRKDETNPHKKAKCFLWECDLESSTSFFKYLSKADPNFCAKIHTNRIDYDQIPATARVEALNIELIRNIQLNILTFEEKWYQKLQRAKAHIDAFKERPKRNSKDADVKKLGKWLCKQSANRKAENDIMSSVAIRREWDAFLVDYRTYMMTAEELWYDNLQRAKAHIDEFKERPKTNSKDANVKKLSRWLYRQSKNRKAEKDIMSSVAIRNEWDAFLAEYRI